MLIKALNIKARIQILIHGIRDKYGLNEVDLSDSKRTKDKILTGLPSAPKESVKLLNDAHELITELMDVIDINSIKEKEFENRIRSLESLIYNQSVELGKLKLKNKELTKTNENLIKNMKL